MILDASGSMRRDDAGGGVTRMKAAQDAVTSLVSGLDSSTSVGLVAYGSRTPGDDVTKSKGCGDVTVEQPLAGSSGSSVVARAKALKAGGWSPIGSARQKLSPQGVQGVSVGQPWATIAKENPGFPSVSGGTSRTFGGRTVTFGCGAGASGALTEGC
ncbi:VWA domain-containing protein [Acidipropionibacterium jensenii]|uniref:VWA domain-containing protein n=1 Tax=Acidipropionibacterium jensenii TaxID=1749 RepID=UPI0013774B9E|nr:VWA domain-containing protein [Acidipropionibacterium jensenii]